MALYMVAMRVGPSPLARIAMINLAAAISAAIAYRGWPALGRTELAYGLAARIPVAIIMLIAMNAHWGTHYELGPPGLPDMGVFALWLWVGLLPQLVLWIGFTVLVALARSASASQRRPIVEPGWEEIADFAIRWANEQSQGAIGTAAVRVSSSLPSVSVSRSS